MNVKLFEFQIDKTSQFFFLRKNKLLIEATFLPQKRTIHLCGHEAERPYKFIMQKSFFLEFPKLIFRVRLNFNNSYKDPYESSLEVAALNEKDELVDLFLPNWSAKRSTGFYVCLGNVILLHQSPKTFNSINLKMAEKVITPYIDAFWNSYFNIDGDRQYICNYIKNFEADFNESKYILYKKNKDDSIQSLFKEIIE